MVQFDAQDPVELLTFARDFELVNVVPFLR